MGGEACLVILAALSSSGAEEGYLTRVFCCEGGRSAVQAQCRAPEQGRTGGLAAGSPGGTQETEDGGGGQVYPKAEMAKEWAVGTR